eukprot:g6826.t1
MYEPDSYPERGSACLRHTRSRPATPTGASGPEIPTANVRVVCRIRPMNEREKKAGATPAATASTERKEVAVVRILAGGTRQVRSTFHFDDVLTSFSSQEDVFRATLQPLVGQVLAGYETTAFAYGQTEVNDFIEGSKASILDQELPQRSRIPEIPLPPLPSEETLSIGVCGLVCSLCAH